MKTTYCPKIQVWIATEPRTTTKILRLTAKGHMALNPEEFHHTQEIRVPVQHALAVGPTEAIAAERGMRRAAL